MKRLRQNYEKKLSMIVPVYNVALYLRECLDSLISQTIDKNDIEIILINDGSTDNSLEICEEYVVKYSNIVLINKNNEGVSIARNTGIKNAKGKYIMFLDSDDTLAPGTIKSVTDFFDSVYDEVDLVTYTDQPIKDGQKLPLHFRYDYLKKTGVYDAEKYPFITQTRINICTKNLYAENILFNTALSYHEDQIYCTEILMNKKKIGYCAEGTYFYNKSNETSIVSTKSNCITLFEPTTDYYENEFGRYDTVPKCIQSLFVNDINWKLKADILWPYHYEKEQFNFAVNRVQKLLNKVDNEIITSHPQVDLFHKAYWLQLKENSNITVFDHALLSENVVVYKREKIELIFHKIKVFDKNKLVMFFTAKSPVFSFSSKPRIYAIINGEKIEINSFSSTMDYYHCRTNTNTFYSFYFEHLLDESEICFKFTVQIDDNFYNTSYYFMESIPFDRDLNVYNIALKNYSFEYVNESFIVKKITAKQELTIKMEQTEKYIFNDFVYNLRKKALSSISDRAIWLYYDCQGVERDNGYYQFIHDFEKKDNIDRYFICANPKETWDNIFDSNQIKNVIEFGSEKHQLLFINSDKILSSFAENVNTIPFEPCLRSYFIDLYHYEFIYLQHGVLHATLPWQYGKEYKEYDKVVVSSYFEKDSFNKKYNFRKDDILPTGMSRFDLSPRNVAPKNRILYAPSWRSYLISECVDRVWQPLNEKLLSSKYFIETQALINNPLLHKTLEEYDMYLDFKPHPIFKCYENLYEIKSDRITISEQTIDKEEYAVFITDFSSFVFDFVYLGRPILYFVPDLPEFKAGLNHYRELDLPFEEAFGDLVETGGEAVNYIVEILHNNCIPQEKYKQRMDSFYLPLDNCREDLYKHLTSEGEI